MLGAKKKNVTSAGPHAARERRWSQIWQIKVAIKLSINSISKHGERGDWSLLIRTRLFRNVEHSQLNTLNTLIPPGAQNEYIIIIISVALRLFLM